MRMFWTRFANDLKTQANVAPLKRRDVDLLLSSDREIGRDDQSLEKRVGLTPASVQHIREFLGARGIHVNAYVVSGAGNRSGFSDHAYMAAGAEIVQPWELAHLDRAPDVVHGLKEPSSIEALICDGEFARIGALHTGEFNPESGLASLLLRRSTTIFDGSLIGGGFRVPIRGAMSRFAGRVAADWTLAHLRDHDVHGRVVVVGAGYVGTAATEALLAENRVTRVDVFDDAVLTDRIDSIRDRFPDGARVVVHGISGCDSPDLLRVLDRASALVLAVARRGEKAPKVLRTESLAGLCANSIVVDVAIDEGGALLDEAIGEDWTHSQVIPHLEQRLAAMSLSFRAIANMPRAYPSEASYVHSETIAPYIIALLFMTAAEGSIEGMVRRVLAESPGADAADPHAQVEPGATLAALVKDLRNGLAYRIAGGRVVIEEPVASREQVGRFLSERGVPFELAAPAAPSVR